MEVVIKVGGKELKAELFDTQLGQKIANILPIEGNASPWGDELYFSIPVTHDLETEQEEVEVGELAYWPPANAFCIFYGPTPASSGNVPRAASEVEVFGRLLGDAAQLKGSRGGAVEVSAS